MGVLGGVIFKLRLWGVWACRVRVSGEGPEMFAQGPKHPRSPPKPHNNPTSSSKLRGWDWLGGSRLLVRSHP